MNVMEIRQAVIDTYPVRQPLMIWGDPGLGKSSAIKQAADALKVDFIDLRLAHYEPIDLRASMTITKSGEMKWQRPWFIPEKGAGILALEELVNCVPTMQACASQLVLDRRVGEHKLGDGWMVVAAGNKLSNRASTHAMPTHIANRFVHLYAEVSLDAWVKWALAAKMDIRLVAFLKWRSELLHKFDPQSKVQAFPSPRSWEFVNGLLKTKLEPRLLAELVKGAIGEGPAAEFMGFLRVFDKMPSIDAILTNPKSATIPTDPATRYAVLTALSARATKDNLHHLVTYFGRMSDEAGVPEYSVAAIKTILGKDPTLGNTKAFIEWSSKHSDLML